MTAALVYTDGSGLASRGPGGVGYAGYVDGRPVEGSRSLPRATNQQAEILAAAYALTELPACDYVRVVSDSEYVVKGMTEWMDEWRKRGWRTRQGKPVANKSHWERLLEAVDRHRLVKWRWCKGHAGTPLNERADELAGAARLSELGLAPADPTPPEVAPWHRFVERILPDGLLAEVGRTLPAGEREVLEALLREMEGEIVESGLPLELEEAEAA